MAGENNITQIYDTSKEIVLPKNTQYVDDGNINVFFEFDSAEQGNAFIATGNYTEEFSVPIALPGGLQVYYNFNETTGLTAVDTQGNHNGTLTNFTGDDSQWVTGQTNNGVRLDGSNDFIDVGDPLVSIFSAPFSISGWFNMDDGVTTTYRPFFGVDDWSGSTILNRVAIYVYNGGIYMFYTSDSQPATVFTPTTTMPNGPTGMYHIVGVWEYPNMRMYINGTQQTASGASDGDMQLAIMSNYNCTRNFRVGGWYFTTGPTEYEFDGVIDEFRIYNKALTSVEVTTLYNNDV